MPVTYEWVIEELADDDEIIECFYWDQFSDAMAMRANKLAAGERFDLAVCRAVGDDVDGETDRQYAYFRDGKWPAEFEQGAVIPKRIAQLMALVS